MPIEADDGSLSKRGSVRKGMQEKVNERIQQMRQDIGAHSLAVASASASGNWRFSSYPTLCLPFAQTNSLFRLIIPPFVQKRARHKCFDSQYCRRAGLPHTIENREKERERETERDREGERHTSPLRSALQRTAPHCSTLQHTATHCNTLQHAATHCSPLQHTATHFNTLQHTLEHTAAHRARFLSLSLSLSISLSLSLS